MSDVYQSSEDIQRAHAADVFAAAERKKVEQNRSEKDKLKAVLDSHIKRHSRTDLVRGEAKKNNRTNDYQLDLSADIVEILEKIKNELR